MYFPQTLSLEATGRNTPKVNQEREKLGIQETGKPSQEGEASCVPGTKGKWSGRNWGKFSKKTNQ